MPRTGLVPRRRLGRHEFAKYHALGNDYIVIDSSTFGVRLTPARVRGICDRRRGAGSDGICARVRAKRGDFGVRIFNPDGSEAEKSGNGVRIFASAMYDLGYTRRRDITIETRAGPVDIQLKRQGQRLWKVRAEIGTATFDDTDQLELGSRSIPVTIVSVGNPHCVVFVDELRREDLLRDGPLLECHPRFPDRTNVQLARVASRKEIELLIWERGAGETSASGTSSSAVAAAAYRRGLIDGDVRMLMPGGRLDVLVRNDMSISMSGPVSSVMRGRFLF